MGRRAINDPDDIEAIQDKIDLFFREHEDNNEPLTFSMFAYSLGYSSRTSVWDLVQSDQPIAEPVKRALLLIEADYEKDLRKQSCTGAIFALKNRGWRDRPVEDDERVLKIFDHISRVVNGNA